MEIQYGEIRPVSHARAALPPRRTRPRPAALPRSRGKFRPSGLLPDGRKSCLRSRGANRASGRRSSLPNLLSNASSPPRRRKGIVEVGWWASPSFPRGKVGPPPCGLGPVRASLSKRDPAASLRLSLGQRRSSTKAAGNPFPFGFPIASCDRFRWSRRRRSAVPPDRSQQRSLAAQPDLSRPGVLAAMLGALKRDCGHSATASQVPPQRLFTRLISGESRIWARTAANRLGHAVAASPQKRTCPGIAALLRRRRNGAVHAGSCPASAVQAFMTGPI
jgi:hypothetical protein